MPALEPYLVVTALDRLGPHLSAPVREAAHKLQGLLDGEGRVQVAKVLEALFPLAGSPNSANASLNRLMRQFNEAADAQGYDVKLVVTAARNVGAAKRYVWFEGPTPAPLHQSTPELNAIPEDRLIADTRGLPLDAHPIVVLLTANEHESAAVTREFCPGSRPRREHREGVDYQDLGVHRGVRVLHTISCAGTSTAGGAQSQTWTAIHAWRPRAVIAVGIAFGVDEGKQALGDVLVSTHIRTYEPARVNPHAPPTPRGSKPDATPLLLKRFKALNQDKSANQGKELWPRLHFGVLLSGDKLVDNLDYRDSLRANFETEAIGGEMEGTGVYNACLESDTHWIIVKAISDWADGQKGRDKTRRQQDAAANAARVVKAAFDYGPLYTADEAPGVSSQVAKPPCPTPRLRDLSEIPDTHLQRDARGLPTSLHKDREEEFGASHKQGVVIMDHLLDWLADPAAPQLFALLGEYGMGKTITCQRLVRELEALRRTDPRLPQPLYFDLRDLTGLRDAVPTLESIVEQCAASSWQADSQGRRHDWPAVNRLVSDGALVIFDGLEEALGKLAEADGQVLTNRLLNIIPDPATRPQNAPRPRLLVSCRTQYFRTLRDQKTHFTGQERGQRGPEAFRALVLLPFGADQIQRYLAAALPEADPERLMDMVRGVHNLEELSSRPYTLKLVAEFIPDIEARRAAGQRVRGVTLYRLTVQRWLERDKGKHQIKPEHKRLLAAHLAAEMWRGGLGLMPVAELESWFHRWLEGQPDLARRYRNLHPDQLEEDLRTATFLARQDGPRETECGFRFAHTSLQEYFLAEYLLDAIRRDVPEQWNLPVSSQETLNFLGQMLDEAEDRDALVRTLSSWRTPRRPGTGELLLAYALAARRSNWPAPILQGVDLRGAVLRGWHFAPAHGDITPLDLSRAILAGADLRETRFDTVTLDGADMSGTRLDQAEFQNCSLEAAGLNDAELPGALFRATRITDVCWNGASAWRARVVNSDPTPIPVLDVVRTPKSTLATEQPRLALLQGHGGHVCSCAFTRDGRYLLSSGEDGLLLQWDITSGECIRHMRACGFGAFRLYFSPDGRHLISCDGDYVVRIWDFTSASLLFELNAHAGPTLACAFSRDGNRLLTGGNDKLLRLWDFPSRKCLREFVGHSHSILACAFSSDEKAIYSVASNYELTHRTLRHWDMESGGCQKEFSSEFNLVGRCHFSQDSKSVVGITSTGQIICQDVESGTVLGAVKTDESAPNCWSVSPDGTKAVSGDFGQNLSVWDLGTGECLRRLPGRPELAWFESTALAFSSDGSRLAAASPGMNGTLRIWDLSSGELARTFRGSQGAIHSCTYSADGARMMSGGIGSPLQLWSTATGTCSRTFQGHTSEVLEISAFGNTNAFATCGIDFKLQLWDPGSDDPILVSRSRGTPLALSVGGTRLLSRDGNWMTLQRVPDGVPLVRFDAGVGDSVGALSRNGKHVASSDPNRNCRVWDASTGKCIRELVGHRSSVMSCDFSPDGSQIVTGGSWNDNVHLRLWALDSGECVGEFSGPRRTVYCCRFSPDGSTVIEGGTDPAIRLWDAMNGDLIREFVGHQSSVFCVEFSPDGRQFVSCGKDRTIRVWDVGMGECIRVHFVTPHGYATWEPTTNHVLEIEGEAWRWLQWLVPDENGEWLPIPLESFAPLPASERLVRTVGEVVV